MTEIIWLHRTERQLWRFPFFNSFRILIGIYWYYGTRKRIDRWMHATRWWYWQCISVWYDADRFWWSEKEIFMIFMCGENVFHLNSSEGKPYRYSGAPIFTTIKICTTIRNTYWSTSIILLSSSASPYCFVCHTTIHLIDRFQGCEYGDEKMKIIIIIILASAFNIVPFKEPLEWVLAVSFVFVYIIHIYRYDMAAHSRNSTWKRISNINTTFYMYAVNAPKWKEGRRMNKRKAAEIKIRFCDESKRTQADTGRPSPTHTHKRRAR